MPNHVHLILKSDSPEAARSALTLAVRGLLRGAGTRGLWQPLPPPSPIPDHKHLLRQIRYVHLNPCRDGLAPDPLCWPWSTHRGLVGGEYQPWVEPRVLSRALSMPHTGFVAWIHGYVSADPSVALCGTPLPAVEPKHALPLVSLAAIRDAVLSAAPLASKAALRGAFVLLGGAQGFHDHALLSRALGITHQHTLRLAKYRNDDLLRAASVCLGDARLRQHASLTPRAGMFKI
jgi:hypothetical protein